MKTVTFSMIKGNYFSVICLESGTRAQGALKFFLRKTSSVMGPLPSFGGASLIAQLVKNPPANAGDARHARDMVLIPESGKIP